MPNRFLSFILMGLATDQIVIDSDFQKHKEWWVINPYRYNFIFALALNLWNLYPEINFSPFTWADISTN